VPIRGTASQTLASALLRTGRDDPSPRVSRTQVRLGIGTLVFIGTKIILVGFIGKFPPVILPAVTFALIAGGIVVSIRR